MTEPPQSNGAGAPSRELMAVRRRAIALADAVLAYSRAFDNYRRAIVASVTAGATAEQNLQQVDLAAMTKPERAAALREFANRLPDQ